MMPRRTRSLDTHFRRVAKRHRGALDRLAAGSRVFGPIVTDNPAAAEALMKVVTGKEHTAVRVIELPHLPFPPSVNTYWRSVTMGHRRAVLISKRGREYRRRVAAEIMRWKAQTHPLSPLTQSLRVTVTLCPPDRRRRDVDNYAKGLLDALVHAGVIEDDSQIDSLTINRGPVVNGGIVAVKLEVLP